VAPDGASSKPPTKERARRNPEDNSDVDSGKDLTFGRAVAAAFGKL